MGYTVKNPKIEKVVNERGREKSVTWVYCVPGYHRETGAMLKVRYAKNRFLEKEGRWLEADTYVLKRLDCGDMIESAIKAEIKEPQNKNDKKPKEVEK